MFVVTKRPTWWVGLLVGIFSTAVMMVLFYLGDRLAGLPFVPFDLFDWVGRIVPGGVITFVIDTMVRLLTALGAGDNLDVAAKTSEQIMALSMFLGVASVSTMVFFLLMNRLKVLSRNSLPGVVFGILFGIPMTVISLTINRSATAEPMMSLFWNILVLVTWGMIVGALYNSLCVIESRAVSEKSDVGLDRREFLVRLGGASAVLTVVGAGLGTLLTAGGEETAVATTDIQPTTDGSGNPLPNVNDPVQAAPGTRAEYTLPADHYRIDISTRPPVIEEADYKLLINGNVKNPVAWTLDDIRQMPSVTEFITQSCISNNIGGSLISTTKWTGVPMQYILDQVQPNDDTVALKIVGADGFDEYLTVSKIREDERIMLAYAWDDQPLPQKNGFPLRIHIPDHYGMKQPKWILEMSAVTTEEDGYWVRRGWSPTAVVRTTSVVDTVATDAIYKRAGRYFVPIGGIAWAGARGIQAVEISIDGGEWQAATLRKPLSERAWVLWRFDWEFTEGAHEFRVRCTDGTSTPQIEEQNPVRPDGATGIHSKRADLVTPKL